MVLNNSQYNAIMREYGARQNATRHELDRKTAEVYLAVPEYKALKDRISALAVKSAKAAIQGISTADCLLAVKDIEQQMEQLLTKAGFPADYLKPEFVCPICEDTGYVNNNKCTCFKQASINLLYNQSNIKDIVSVENFDTLSFDYYSSNYTDSSTGLTPLANAQKVVDMCREFVRSFPAGDNILFYGDTGVGKTFLSNCIAKALLDEANSVLYVSAIDLFKYFSASSNFVDNSGLDKSAYESQIIDCDLLIIDDLGTELVNSFTNSKLFYCINTRLLEKRSTIISTNLTLSELMSMYSERIFSRISSSYKLLKLFGDDIRLTKK